MHFSHMLREGAMPELVQDKLPEFTCGERLLQLRALKFLLPRSVEILLRVSGGNNNSVVPDDFSKGVKAHDQSMQRAMFKMLGERVPRRQ